ncbi:MAG TPA: hypothetical protein VGJ97_00525, partial [Anaerolineaceae bacterium]
MPAFYWIKLFHEIVDDPKMALMPDRLWRRTVELFLLAGRHNQSGLLPDTRQLAWELRMPTDDLQLDLEQIERTGILQRVQSGWLVTHFEKRQSPADPAERKRQQRSREKSPAGHGPVTHPS